jgi:hypothetical protein
MTQQEKAKHLVSLHSLTILSKIGHKLPMDEVKEIAKAAALIAVDELIESFNSIYDASIRNIEKYSGAKYGMKDYWDDVKQEIEKL